MDILYLIGENCSKCNYNELRYSLRSIEKYGKNVGRVYVAGYCPDWLSDNVYKVSLEEPYKHPANIVEKHLNMLYTIMHVVDNTDISDDFLVSMDDHFYIKQVDFDNYPIYAKIVAKDVQLASKKNPPNKYGDFILGTKALLQKFNLPTYFLTLHRNMHVYRDTVNQCRHLLNLVLDKKLKCEPIAFMLNYRYKQNPFKFVPIKDIKIRKAEQWLRVNSQITEVFSTYDFETNSELDTLIGNLFPNKSKYEK